MRFLSTFGRLPGTWLNLALILFSGLLEGFGIALFIPLLQLLLGGPKTVTAGGGDEISQHLFKAPEMLGLTATPVTLLVMIGVLILGSLLVNYAQRYVLIGSKYRITMRLREKVLQSFFNTEWPFSSSHPQGKVVNLLTTECARAGIALAHELQGVATALQIMVFVTLSFIISWKLVLITAPFAIFSLLVVRPFVKQARALGERNKTLNQALGTLSVDYLRGLKILRATASTNIVTDRISARCRDLFDVNVRSELNTTQIYFIIQALPILLIVVVLGMAHELLGLSATFVMGFLLFLARIAPRAAQFQQAYQSYLLVSPAIRVVDAFITASREAEESTHPDGPQFSELKHGVKFDAVSYHFNDGDEKALHDVSLAINRNQFIALVGSSGAGKSTMTELLIGLRRPTEGRVLVDETDLVELDLNSWRRRVGYVAQDTVLFNDTLRNNLLFFAPGASEENLRWAMQISHLDEVVADLPEGLETQVGESGVRFSGGQRQRIALARALVAKPELLILDEATSALDNESERYIQDALESIRHTMTIVVIAHRLSTVRKADRIYVMEAGEVIEEGDFNSLLASGGRFKDLHDMQFK